MRLSEHGGTSPDLRVLFGRGRLGLLTDGQLLEQFARDRDEAGELAFAALLDRHGPMVLRVCRSLLRDPNDAEDAFQATFLVLARKARSLWVHESIGPWLHGVAYRIATRVLSDRARRRRHEQAAAELAATEVEPGEPDDLGPVLHEEIGRLPEPVRAAIVLCYLEGLTHDQAAHRLGWPVGTVRSRLARGRDRLRGRLDERGVAPAIALLAPGSVGTAASVIRPSLAVSTVRAASRTMTGTTAAGTGPAVTTLTEGVLRMMMLKTWLKIAAAVVLAGFLATGAAALAYQGSENGQDAAGKGSKPAAAAKPAAPPKSEAETIAETFLKAGAALFNAKNAEGLAATYTEEGEVILVGKKDGEVTSDVKQGRGAIEEFYRNHFKNIADVDCQNTVEFARLISPDIIVVHGRFRPNTGENELPFVQMRIKQDGHWLLSKLWLFIMPGA